MNFCIIFSSIIKHIFVTFSIRTQLSNTNLVITLTFILFHRYEIVCCFIKCSFFCIQHKNSPSLTFLKIQIKRGMQTIKSCSMSFNCKFQLTYLEWYRIHYKIFCSWAKYNLIYESLVGVWITHCDLERLRFLNKNLLIRISLLIIRLLLLLLLLLGLLYESGYLLLLLFFKLLLLQFQLTLLLVEYFLLLLKLSHFDPMTVFLRILAVVPFLFIVLVFFWW
jgi:hypothetical protein